MLLTDGMGETNNYNDIVNSCAENKITLSTVAVGSSSDKRLLQYLAEECGGRYYYSDISSDIPKIFAQEVFLGGDSYIQNGAFSLSVQAGHELTGNLFPNGWPSRPVCGVESSIVYFPGAIARSFSSVEIPFGSITTIETSVALP